MTATKICKANRRCASRLVSFKSKMFPCSFAKCRPPSFPHETDFDSWCCFPSLSFSCYVQLGKKVSTISSFFFRATNPFKKMRGSSWWFKKELRDPFFSQFFFVIVQLFTFGQTSKFQVALYSSDLNKMPSKSLFYALVPLVNLLQDNLFASSNITPRHMLLHMLRQRNYISYHVGTLICPVKYEI